MVVSILIAKIGVLKLCAFLTVLLARKALGLFPAIGLLYKPKVCPCFLNAMQHTADRFGASTSLSEKYHCDQSQRSVVHANRFTEYFLLAKLF